MLFLIQHTGVLPSPPRENGGEIRDGALSPASPSEKAASARLAGDRADAQQPTKACELQALPLIKQVCVAQHHPLFRAYPCSEPGNPSQICSSASC